MIPALAPEYRSHKTVRALEIETCVLISDGERIITFTDPKFDAVKSSREHFARYVPVKGDFYVVYPDGYTSVSPRKAFLDGYSRIDG